jgi:hypothetical protein
VSREQWRVHDRRGLEARSKLGPQGAESIGIVDQIGRWLDVLLFAARDRLRAQPFAGAECFP